MDWLRHDTDSRDDPKLLRLEAIYGNEGYAYFWKAVEVIAQQGGSLPREDALLAFRIAWRLGSKQKAKCEEVLSNLLATGLLTEANDEIVSRRLQGELEYADELREKRSKAGRRSGEVRRALGGSAEGNTCSTNDEQMFKTCSTQVEPDLTDLTNLPNQPTLTPPTPSPVFQEEVRVFLEVYPPTLKRQENAVWKAYQVARRLVSAEDILEGARQYARHVADTKTTPQYTKSAVRWLEEEGWTAQYAKPQEKSLHGNYSPDEVAI